MQETKIVKPTFGEKITMGADGKLNVPNFPIIPYVEGDGTGPDITAAAMIVWDAAVKAAGRRLRLKVRMRLSRKIFPNGLFTGICAAAIW